MPYATDKLVKEHEVILRMIAVIDNVLERLQKGEDVDPKDMYDMVDFIRNFADKYHHAKEEDILFERMIQIGFPKEGGPIQVMLADHDLGREYTRKFEEGIQKYEQGDSSAIAQIVENAGGYGEHLTMHIQKENNILYPMGDRHFSEQDQEFLKQEFEKVEKEKLGVDTFDKYLKMVERLEEKYKV